MGLIALPRRRVLVGGANGEFTITIGKQTAIHSWWSTHSPTEYYDGYGYDGGADYHSYATDVGDLQTGQTYEDGGAVTRTISAVIYSTLQWMYFSIDGTSVPDDDDTFVSITVDTDHTFARADAGYTASQNGGTHWWWAQASNVVGQTGDIPFVVNL